MKTFCKFFNKTFSAFHKNFASHALTLIIFMKTQGAGGRAFLGTLEIY